MWKPQTKDAVLREIKIREWRKRIGKALVSALGRLFLTTAKSLTAVWLWTREQSAKVAHDIELNRLVSQKHDKLLHLGETVYAMYRAGEISWQTVEALCREIEGIDRQLDAARTLPLQVLPFEPKGEQALPESASASQ